jgi:hypothetical protein
MFLCVGGIEMLGRGGSVFSFGPIFLHSVSSGPKEKLL